MYSRAIVDLVVVVMIRNVCRLSVIVHVAHSVELFGATLRCGNVRVRTTMSVGKPTTNRIVARVL